MGVYDVQRLMINIYYYWGRKAVDTEEYLLKPVYFLRAEPDFIPTVQVSGVPWGTHAYLGSSAPPQATDMLD